jgi:predicted phage terminase large subunit-like protein
MWLLIHKQLSGMVLIGKNSDDANGLLSDLQAELQFNELFKHDFGEQYNHGSWENGNFIIKDDIEFIALGRGQSPRGIRNRQKRPNYCVVDDIDDDEIVENQDRVKKTVRWIKGSLYGALRIKGARFVMVGNRIHKKSILARIVGDIDGKKKNKGVYHSKVYAIVNGKPAWHENYTVAVLQRKFEVMGYYLSQREFFHNPIVEGNIFKEAWIKWDKMPKLSEFDHIIAYFDPSYKAKTTDDFKAIKVWGKKGVYLYHLKAFLKQCSINDSVKWFYDFHESLPEDVICDYYMEEVFLQDLFFDDFDNEGKLRGYILPIRGDKRAKPDKLIRISALSPLWQRGWVIYNEAEKKDADMITGIEQLLALEKGSSVHDDGPDADEGAIWLLQKQGRDEAFTPRIGVRKHKEMW